MSLRHLLFALALGGSLTACVDDSTGPAPENSTTETFDYSAMFANIADTIIVPNYQALASEAADFAADSGTLATYCGAIGSAGEASARSAAQSDWEALMQRVQATELHALGPVIETDADDRVLRYRINNFSADSLFSTCGVDQSVVLNQQSPDFSIDSRSTNQRGIIALEYLLFNDDLGHTCPSQVSETADWDARPAQERKQWRCEYAQVVAGDLADAAQTVLTAWQSDGGNYRSQFISPANQADNLKALSDALFAIETDVKDKKLGVPLGIHNDCGQLACPQKVESPYANVSLASIEINLAAFGQLFTGGDGLSFDDIIVDEGFADVANNFVAMTDTAETFAADLDGTLAGHAQAIVDSGSATACNNSASNPDADQSVPACSLHGYIKRITDALRTDFVQIVNLDLPDRAQSDND